MGAYSEYLSKQMPFDQLTAERKRQLARISKIRGRGILVYASDLSKNCPNSIEYADELPFSDQLSLINGDAIDIILETPGGLAEVVEDLVNQVRKKFQKVGVIVPGYAKSAGTIFAMAADEILMGNMSSLGPIDAQIVSNGKHFSADAFLEGFKKIRDESNESKRLDIAYIPILQGISPGEIQHYENAQSFSKTLVTNWLKEYKFKFWNNHKSTGFPVTAEEKKARANQIASQLCNHSHWLTHGRSIKIEDLKNMKLEIIDYTETAELDDAINRYYTLLRMSFETNIYKIFETPSSQIYRSLNPVSNPPQLHPQILPNPLQINIKCGKCGLDSNVQVNFDTEFPLNPGSMPFPADNKFVCPSCGSESELLGLRQQLEAQTGKKII